MGITASDIEWMHCALQAALKAQAEGEVPVGAVLVSAGEVIAEGWNCPITRRDPTAHAEIVALRSGAVRLENYRLCQAALYVTLEPCVMCAGAIMQARIPRVVFGAFDPKSGAAGSVFDILCSRRLNHFVSCEGGVLAEKSGPLLANFFRERRKKTTELGVGC